MNAWVEWAQAHSEALLDPAAPHFRKRLVTSASVTEFEDTKTGYAIVEASSHDNAVEVFSTHPHLSLISGNSIEVIECPTLPS